MGVRKAKRLSGMSESLIREMTRVALEHDALNLSQGLPDFDPPALMREAAAAALQGHSQYTISWGAEVLRRAVASRLEVDYGRAVDPDREVTITCGVTEGIVAAVLGVVDPGERVVVIEPAHENYLPAIRFAGAEPSWVTLRAPHFELDRALVARAFDPRPRAVIVNSPHNPSGRVFTREELVGLAELCCEHDVVAITDEIYEHLVFDGRTHVPLATLPGMAGRTITVSGLSKSYAATGWRVGWVTAPPPLTDALRTVHDYLTICAPAPLQHAASVALTQLPSAFYVEQRLAYTKRRDRIVTALARAGFRLAPPEGSYYVMADYRGFQEANRDCPRGLDDVAFARWLAADRKVATVPGSAFYHDSADGRHLVRFAFPKQLTTLEEVGRRLRGSQA